VTIVPPQKLSLETAWQQAVAHHQAGRLHQAEQLYRAILQTQPGNPDVNHNLGVLAGQAGQHAAGLPYLKAAMAINPAHEQYVLSYVDALLIAGQPDDALNILKEAIQRGLASTATKTLQQRVDAAIRKQRAHGGNVPPSEMNVLASLFHGGQYTELEIQARILSERYPNSGNAWKALSTALLMQSKNAIPSLQKTVELLPYDAEPHCNLGKALRDLGQLNEAVASCRRALSINPDFAEAHCNLGNALQDLGQLDDAVASFRRALEIKPDYIQAQSNLLLILNYQSDQPASMLLNEARRFGELTTGQARPYADWNNVKESGKCLRVGLVSGDLRNHPVGYFLEGVLSAMTSCAHGRLEFIAYHNHPQPDTLTDRIKSCCVAWRDTLGLSDEGLARQIRDDSIDILLDLSGHTAHNRLPMFAWKPAPVQASWLGYFATTGVAAMDYLIADPWTLPPSEESCFTEEIWRMPETRLCFTPPDGHEKVGPLPALGNGFVTFGCFNNLMKMNDAVVALWARILASVPASCLFLKANQLNEESVRTRTIERFSARGITVDRLLLEGHTPRSHYLTAYHRIDIALDPFPFTGGTTTAESLWMGVPVLTLAGERFISRQGVGLLMNAGLSDWVANDADEYVSRAVFHASDLRHLATLRSGLHEQVLRSSIFDASRFALHFEAALREMWSKWCEQQEE